MDEFLAKTLESTLCTFACFEDCANGIFAAGFDTLDNSLLHAKRRENYILRLNKTGMAREGAVPYCDRLVRDHSFPRIEDFNGSFSKFKYAGIFTDRIPAWTSDYSVTPGFIFLLALNIMDRLVAEGAFPISRLVFPFRLGFCSKEREDMIVMKLLNWPAHSGPRV
jgi:hypothetical protein